MPAFTIQRILEDAAKKNQIFQKNEESHKWFYERARRTLTSSSKLIREYSQQDLRTTTQLQIGCLYFFFYDPKWKDELPYYDRFPCVFLTDIWKDAGGRTQVAGLNLHYLPYKQRALLMDALLDLENNATMTRDKKLKISYGILKKAAASKWFAPTYKRYLKSHMRSKLVKVPYEEWTVATFLPVQEFEKATMRDVWADSLNKINGKPRKSRPRSGKATSVKSTSVQALKPRRNRNTPTNKNK